MKNIVKFLYLSLLSLISLTANANCYFGIKNSGANIPPYIQGQGTKEQPFQLQAGKDLCDITLVKQTQDTNLSYPDDRIYFEYHYKNVPLNFKGQLVNWLKIAMVTNEYSRFTPSMIMDSNYSSACQLIFDQGSSGSNDPAGRNQQYYNTACMYSAPDGTPANTTTLSGTVSFSISLQGNQEIRRFTDSNGQLQGAASISINWLNPPLNSNFDL